MVITASFYWNMIIFLAIFNMVASLLLLLYPNKLVRVNDVVSRWIPTDKFEETINKRRNIDKSIFGSRKLFGVTSLLLSIVLFAYIYVSH